MRRNRRWKRLNGTVRFVPVIAGILLISSSVSFAAENGSSLDRAFELAVSAVIADRIESCQLLAAEDSQKALDKLVAMLGDDSSRVVVSSLNALGRAGRVEAVEIIGNKLLDNSSGVRAAAINALGRLKTPESTRLLLHHLDKSNGPEKNRVMRNIVAHRAESAVGRLVAALEKDDANPALYDALTACSGLVFDNASGWRSWWRSSGKLGRRGWLVEALESEDVRNRARAARCLGTWGGDSSIESLIDALGDPSSGVRAAASSSVKKLSGLDMDYDPDVDEKTRKEGIVRWRRWWRGARAMDRRSRFLGALRRGTPRNKVLAVHGLSDCFDRDVALALIDALGDESSGVREAAFFVLKRRARDDYGYDPDAEKKERRAAVGRFLKWWAVEFGK